VEIFNIRVGEIESIEGLPELDKDLLQIAQTEVTYCTKLGQQALKTASPVYTGSLRNSIKIQGGGSEKQVVIEEQSHYSGFGTVELSEILDTENYRRSQQSIKEGPFDSIVRGSPTTDWIEHAQDNLEDYLNNNG
jgi:hypothetical protein